ncbi:hypothetical protein I6A84_05530, partial [Frankia sp. CNm7]|nr:hypothetical protein [Frankia nepalensis]
MYRCSLTRARRLVAGLALGGLLIGAPIYGAEAAVAPPPPAAPPPPPPPPPPP